MMFSKHQVFIPKHIELTTGSLLLWESRSRKYKLCTISDEDGCTKLKGKMIWTATSSGVSLPACRLQCFPRVRVRVPYQGVSRRRCSMSRLSFSRSMLVFSSLRIDRSKSVTSFAFHAPHIARDVTDLLKRKIFCQVAERHRCAAYL